MVLITATISFMEYIGLYLLSVIFCSEFSIQLTKVKLLYDEYSWWTHIVFAVAVFQVSLIVGTIATQTLSYMAFIASLLALFHK